MNILDSIDMRPTAWMRDAACVGMDPELFFPDNQPVDEVLAVCAGCPVRDACREFAETNLYVGVWGEPEEQRILRRRTRGMDTCPAGKHPYPESARIRRADRTSVVCAECDREKRREDYYAKGGAEKRRQQRKCCSNGHEWALNETWHADGRRRCKACERIKYGKKKAKADRARKAA